MFDQFYISVYNNLKAPLKQKAQRFALIYITFLQASLLLLVGILLAQFCKQMHIRVMASSSAWLLFCLVVFILYITNWLRYNGKKRLKLNLNISSKLNHSIWILLLLPIGITFLAILLLLKV